MLKRIATSILIFLSVIIIINGLNKPTYNFDRLFYMGLVLNLEHISYERSHKIVINEFKKKLNNQEFKNKFNSCDYNRNILNNSKSYIQQIPLYTTKPLYVILYYLTYKISGKILESGVYLNVFFYLLTYFLFLFIIYQYVDFLLGSFLAFFIFCNPMSLNVLSYGTPDVVATFFVLLFSYSVFFRSRNIIFIIFSILLMIFSRNDNVIFSFFSILFLYIFKKVSIKESLLIIFFVFVSYFLSLKVFDDYYGFYTTYHHTFISLLSFPKEFVGKVGIKQMIGIALTFGNTYIERSFFLLSILIFVFSKLYSRKIECNFFEMSILFTIIVKYLLFPALWDRFYFIFVILLILIFFKSYYTKLSLEYERK